MVYINFTSEVHEHGLKQRRGDDAKSASRGLGVSILLASLNKLLFWHSYLLCGGMPEPRSCIGESAKGCTAG
eukprot:1394818-Amphidinium_carterae.1